MLSTIELNLYEAKILASERTCDYLPYLERLLYELSADASLSNGVFYAFTLKFEEENEPSRLID